MSTRRHRLRALFHLSGFLHGRDEGLAFAATQTRGRGSRWRLFSGHDLHRADAVRDAHTRSIYAASTVGHEFHDVLHAQSDLQNGWLLAAVGLKRAEQPARADA